MDDILFDFPGGDTQNGMQASTYNDMCDDNSFNPDYFQNLLDNISDCDSNISGHGVMLDDPESLYRGQWSKIEELSRTGNSMVKSQINDLMKEMSDSFINITFRRSFAEFIECKAWDRINTTDTMTDSDSTGMASALIKQLKGEVESQLIQMDRVNGGSMEAQDFRIQCECWVEKLEQLWYYPLHLVKYIQKNLHQERAIINFAQENPVSTPMFLDPSSVKMENCANNTTSFMRISEISNDIMNLEKAAQQSAASIQSLIHRVQQVQITSDNNLIVLDQMDITKLSQQQLEKLKEFKNRIQSIKADEDHHVNNFLIQPYGQLNKTVRRVLDEELVQWQRNQGYVNIGKSAQNACDITHLESWMKKLAKLVSTLMYQTTDIERLESELGITRLPYNPPQIATNIILYLRHQYSLILHELVRKGLVVEKQPPQVLMKDKRFSCQLRHLISDGLDIHKLAFEVEASLLNAEQADKALKEGPMANFVPTGKIVNNTARSDYIDHLRQLSVNMRNMCLKMQQRGAARNAEMVAELKFGMLFRAKIAVRLAPQSTAIVIAETMSLPIVVISHGKQEADAQATIFMDNAFSSIGRTPFEVDDSVPWSYMLECLNARWIKETEEGGKKVGLSPESQEYLTMKLFNEKRVPANTAISWKKFNHDKLFQCGTDSKRELFTFWTWFFKAMELVSSQHVKKYWNAGAIHGFLSKADCQRKLLESGQPGVFLFRFSETKLGAISISCSTMNNGQLQVRHLEPDVMKNFQVRSLPDMVNDLKYLQMLYPNKPKDSVFGAYYSIVHEQPNVPSSDYIPKGFVVQTREPRAALDHLCSGVPSPNVVFGEHDPENMHEDMK